MEQQERPFVLAAVSCIQPANLPLGMAEELSIARTRGGAGAGVRLLIPGSEMVRFDVAWSEQQGFQFHLATGTKPVAQRQRLR